MVPGFQNRTSPVCWRMGLHTRHAVCHKRGHTADVAQIAAIPPMIFERNGWPVSGPYPKSFYRTDARYKAGNPKALPQSLAKTTAFESSSHAGDQLLHFPP